MEQHQGSTYDLAPLGMVEPHAQLLKLPPEGQALYKIMTVDHMLRSVLCSYLHFNRVDSYVDFPCADAHDGQQLSGDRLGNTSARFERAPEFSAADLYDQSRARTFACCFSLENSNHTWSTFGDSAKGKVCVVFSFDRLRARLNRTLQPGNAALMYNDVRCRQIFSVNYGMVEYIDWGAATISAATLPNPIRYTYLKDKRFSRERELRVSLSAPGIGHFALSDDTRVQFPKSLQLSFDFQAAVADGTILKLLCSPHTDADLLTRDLFDLRIVAQQG